MPITYEDTLNLALDNGVSPARCERCGNTERTDLAWQTGHDDHRDAHYVGFQCLGCGNVQGMTRASILRRLRTQR